MSITKVFRSTDTFRMNEWPHNDEYISFEFVSGLNVAGYKYDEEHDYHSYLLYFDENSKHVPEKLKENLPEYSHLYLWNAEDDYWAVESDSRENMMSFFRRDGARLYLSYYADWSYKNRLVEWCADNNNWHKFEELLERWQSGNASDC